MSAATQTYGANDPAQYTDAQLLAVIEALRVQTRPGASPEAAANATALLAIDLADAKRRGLTVPVDAFAASVAASIVASEGATLAQLSLDQQPRDTRYGEWNSRHLAHAAALLSGDGTALGGKGYKVLAALGGYSAAQLEATRAQGVAIAAALRQTYATPQALLSAMAASVATDSPIDRAAAQAKADAAGVQLGTATGPSAIPFADPRRYRAWLLRDTDKGAHRAYEDDRVVTTASPEVELYLQTKRDNGGKAWSWNGDALSSTVLPDTEDFRERVMLLRSTGLDPNNMGGSLENLVSGIDTSSVVGMFVGAYKGGSSKGQAALRAEICAKRDQWCAENGVPFGSWWAHLIAWLKGLGVVGVLLIAGAALVLLIALAAAASEEDSHPHHKEPKP